MAGIQDITAAIAQLGAVASAAALATADATREATAERTKYNEAVRETKRIETSAAVTDASPNRDRSRDVGATAGTAGSNLTAAGVGAALALTRGRS